MQYSRELSKWEKMMVDYGFFHQDKFNVLTHLIFVPVIVASVLIPLTFVGISTFKIGGVVLPLNLGLIAVIALSVFYISLDRKLGIISIPILLFLLLVATNISMLGFSQAGIIAIIGFFGGFGVQFVGHAVEGKKPALIAYNPIIAVLSSPLFVVAEYAKPFGVHKELWKRTYDEIQQMELLNGEKVVKMSAG